MVFGDKSLQLSLLIQSLRLVIRKEELYILSQESFGQFLSSSHWRRQQNLVCQEKIIRRDRFLVLEYLTGFL